MPPPLPQAPYPSLAIARLQGDGERDNKGKGKARATPGDAAAPPALPSHALNGRPGPLHGAVASSSRHYPDLPLSKPGSRKLGLLGIPLSDSEDDDMEDGMGASILASESVEANPPVSPVVTPAAAPAAPTYSRGGSTRSGPSTRGEKQSEGTAFVSEQNFRDIVDDLTLQNQQLRAKLKRFESAKVPSSMKNERLFEVRFFQGLPKTRRREIETFLTDYVQVLSTSESLQGSTGSLTSRLSRGHKEVSTNDRDQGDSISSVGPSLRSSEKDALARATLRADADAAEAAGSLKGSRGSRSGGSATRSGSGSGNSKDQRRASEAGVPRYDPTRTHEPLGSAPITSINTNPDPPSLLRRPTDIFPSDRDVLAAPSFSGVEPLSTTGTGHEMRISDPLSRKRKRLTSGLSNEFSMNKARRTHSTRTSSTAGSVTSHDPDALENTIVQMIECLFLESLPPDSDDEAPDSPPLNPLQSEPYPLPARSSSNTQYLRTILASEEYRHVGGWVYLNIVATFAALHRLSASIATVRHALRTRSDLIEVSVDGSKIRWKGPSRKPPRRALEAQAEVMEECANELEEEREKDEVQIGFEGGDRRSRSQSISEPATESMFEEQPSRPPAVRQNSSSFATSTAPTSLNPTMSKNGSNSKNGSEWQTRTSSSNGTRSAGGDRVRLVGAREGDRFVAPLPRGRLPKNNNNSSLRNSVEEVGSPARLEVDEVMEALGSGVEAQQLKRHQYTPLFARRAGSAKSEEDSPESASEIGSTESRKRRKRYEGGVVYFANDLFCSDLAGDFEVRAKLKLAAHSASSSSILLGEDSSRDPMETDEADSVTRSADSKMGEEEEIPDIQEEAISSKQETANDWSEIVEELPGSAYTPLEILECNPLSPEIFTEDAYLSAPRPALRLSAMSNAIAADHFTIHIKYLHHFSPLPPASPVPPPNRRIFARPSMSALSTLFTPDYTPALFCAVPPPLTVESKTFHHHPSVFTRPPRVLMSLSSDASESGSDSEETTASGRRSTQERRRKRRLKNSVIRGQRFDMTHGGGGDYLMSLALPLNRWAPVTKRSMSIERLSSSRAGTGSGEPSESLITLD
ncbi:hypothetical protein JCM16303_001614 [Sporobolomyces ruberrimus]